MNLGEYALPISLLLCGCIFFTEFIRQHNKFRIDLLFGVNIIYLICFGIVPIFLFTTDLSYLPKTHWIRKIPLDDSAYLYASITSLIGYLFILAGYNFAKRVKFIKKNRFEKNYSQNNDFIVKVYYPEKKLSFVAMSLFLLGLVSLLIYVKSIGGVKTALETATLYRSGRGPVASRWLFLKNIAPLIMIASYFYYALKFYNTKSRKRYDIMFVITFVISIYLLLLLSGRLSLVSYIVIFPLYRLLHKNKGHIKFVLCSLVFALIIILIGDPLFRAFRDPDQFINILKAGNMSYHDISRAVLTEFSFPFINLANLLTLSRKISFRFFTDIFIGLATLVPQSLLGIKTPDTLSQINTEYFGTSGTIPVDLVSFGYYSLSIPGVILVTFFFGIIIRLFDVFFPPQKTAIESIFRAAWIIFLAFRVMYGDVTLVVKGGFELFVGTILLFLIRTRQFERYKSIYVK